MPVVGSKSSKLHFVQHALSDVFSLVKFTGIIQKIPQVSSLFCSQGFLKRGEVILD